MPIDGAPVDDLLCVRGPAGFNRTWVRLTYRLGVLIGSADLRPAVPSARRVGRPKVRPYFRPADRPADRLAEGTV